MIVKQKNYSRVVYSKRGQVHITTYQALSFYSILIFGN